MKWFINKFFPKCHSVQPSKKTSYSQDVESIELRRGLVYNLERAIVEMSEALPVEDRLVIFDAVRLPEPRQLDHHCVRYEGANVSPIPGPLNWLY